MFVQGQKKQTTLPFGNAKKNPTSSSFSSSNANAGKLNPPPKVNAYTPAQTVSRQSSQSTNTGSQSEYFGTVRKRSFNGMSTTTTDNNNNTTTSSSSSKSYSSYEKGGNSYSSISSSKRQRNDFYNSSRSNSIMNMAIPNHSLPPTSRAAPPSSSAKTAAVHSSKPVSTNNIITRSGVTLSQQQLEALDLVINKKVNVFITGSAGTGKSVLMSEMIRLLKDSEPLGVSSGISVCAPTGIAAFHIGGQTIHSFSGIGIGNRPIGELVKRVKRNKQAVERWRKTRVLIVDEVSMLDGELFDKLDLLAKEVRGNRSPFGGIQLVITGDFYQLPPVNKDSQSGGVGGGAGSGGVMKFCFEAEMWKKCITKVVVLTQVFRQKDMTFIDMLNEMRIGKISPETEKRFRQLSRVPSYPNDGIYPTELYALRYQVENANKRKLDQLKGTAYIYNSMDGSLSELIQSDKSLASRVESSSIAPKQLVLKQYAQVMLTKNMPEQNLVNGSRGVVTRFAEIDGREYPVCKFTNGVEIVVMPDSWNIEINNKEYKRIQIPLVLAWALSIHKSQGQTIDRVVVDLGKVFEKGQAYVALSRATGLDGLQVLNFRPSSIMAHPKVINYYASLARMNL